MSEETFIERFWKPALGVGGVAAIGAFVFYSIYSKWLELDIFDKLNSEQTYTIMLLFLVLVFAIALSMVVAWLIDKSRHNTTTVNNSVTYSIPESCSFEQAVRAIVAEDSSVVEFKGFSNETLRVSLKSQTINAKSALRAIELLKNVSESNIPKYSVQKKDGKYLVSVTDAGGH